MRRGKPKPSRRSRLADNGKWQQAVAIIDRLGQQYGADPTLVFNRALLGGWLADDRALVAGLHAYAQLDVPLDDAIEAEAIAQLLDPDLKEPQIDSVLRTYAVNDEDALVRVLSSDRRFQRLKMDPAALAQADGPPPRHTFVLFDRPMPESGVDLTRDAVPRLVGILAIFGRQTDRPERLEVTVDKGRDFDAAIRALKEIAGDALGDDDRRESRRAVSPTEQALNWRWQFPRDTPPDVRRRLLAEERRAAIVERWPTLPRPALGGKTPREAAGDAATAHSADGRRVDPGARQQHRPRCRGDRRAARELGLPQPEPIEPGGESVSGLPLARVPRLKMEAVSDDDLVQLYRRAIMAAAQAAIACLAQEAVRRPSLADRIPPAEAYQRLIAAERDPDRALALIDEGARAEPSRPANRPPPGTWPSWSCTSPAAMPEQAKETLARIEREHLDDPQVAAALYQLLYETGVDPSAMRCRRQRRLKRSRWRRSRAAPEPAGGRIWTPDSDRPAGGKSTLWTPS